MVQYFVVQVDWLAATKIRTMITYYGLIVGAGLMRAQVQYLFVFWVKGWEAQNLHQQSFPLYGMAFSLNSTTISSCIQAQEKRAQVSYVIITVNYT